MAVDVCAHHSLPPAAAGSVTRQANWVDAILLRQSVEISLTEITEAFMEQGWLSNSCYASLTAHEIRSLSRIREHYCTKTVFKLSTEQTLSLIDRAYEAMGRSFRNRINAKTLDFGRYSGELDGVFIIISDALRTYDTADLFPSTPTEAKENFTSHKKHLNQVRKKLDTGFSDITNIINSILQASWLKSDNEKMRDYLSSLNEIRSFLEKQIEVIDFGDRPESRAEAFVNGVCMSLVWTANIKPTKPMTDSHNKNPLLRFLEVFYPVEAHSVLSKIYDRERTLPPEKRIGATFLAPI